MCNSSLKSLMAAERKLMHLGYTFDGTSWCKDEVPEEIIEDEVTAKPLLKPTQKCFFNELVRIMERYEVDCIGFDDQLYFSFNNYGEFSMDEDFTTVIAVDVDTTYANEVSVESFKDNFRG